MAIATSSLKVLRRPLEPKIYSGAQYDALNESELTELFTRNDDMLAVKSLAQTLLDHEALEVCALWERFDPAGFSIPTLIAILDSESVLEAAEAYIRDHCETEDPQTTARHSVSRLKLALEEGK